MTDAKKLVEVRKCMENARSLLSRRDHYGWTPPKRQTWTYQHQDMTVHFHGESLGSGPVAEYHGSLGHFQANINPHSIGKPWEVSNA